MCRRCAGSARFTSSAVYPLAAHGVIDARPPRRPTLGRTRGSVSEVDRDALHAIIDRHRATTDTVQELAIVALRQAILDGVMPPGARLRRNARSRR